MKTSNKKGIIIGLIILMLVIGIGYWVYLNLNNLQRSDKDNGDDDSEISPIQYNYSLEEAFPNLVFNTPIGIYEPKDGTNRLFVVEKEGKIIVFEKDYATSESSIFLDIQSNVSTDGERGLLGLAFHPDYAINGYFFIDYTNTTGDTILARYQVNGTDMNKANVSSFLEIMSIEQPFANHNGGQIAFGPDGYLYFALGDGGSGGDPLNNSQDLTTLLGAVLRIDTDSGDPYSIPGDNPFSSPNREEIYAYGFRNPWRFSFDSLTGDLWLGDVGQGSWEEINIVEKGKNYGWNAMEGNHSFSSGTVILSSMVRPIFEYANDEITNAITGGFVYRGKELTKLNGTYIYADFGSGLIWGLTYTPGELTENILLVDADFLIASFGVDSDDEIYVCQYAANAHIYKLVEKIM